MAPLQPSLTTGFPKLGRSNSSSLLSPVEYDADAASIRSDQDSDSEDDELQARARNSRELRAHDRMVFMEEDETDRLVTDARRREQDRGRRGSGLVNPLRLLGVRRPSDSGADSRPMTGMSSASGTAVGSTDSLLSGKEQHGAVTTRAQKRQQRRRRREEKKDRLLAKAHHGEDGELMYEMEEGGLKEGSSTGASSERENDDDDVTDDDDDDGVSEHRNSNESFGGDNDRLLADGQGRPRRRRQRPQKKETCCCGRKNCGRWVLVHLLIAVALALLVLGAWKLTLARRRERQQVGHVTSLVSNGSALFGPTTLIISLDGFRADFLQRGLTPRLNAFVREGVSPRYMLPSFPSVTFPNHYTLATGLYPESHGVVGNSFWDPSMAAEFFYTDPNRSLDPKWWGGEPFWVTAERAGVRSAVHMWPGSEAHIQGVEPAFVDKFNGREPLENKVARILELLDKPGPETETGASASANMTGPSSSTVLRPQLIAAYVPNVDADGHRYGPNSTEIRGTIAAVDAMLDDLFHGLEARNLTGIVNVIIVSDHGMATTSVSRLLQLEDLVGPDMMDRIAHVDGWPLVGLRPKAPHDLELLHASVINRTRDNPNVEVYLRDVDMPDRYHFSRNERIAPLWLIPKTGWNIVQRSEFDVAEAQAQGLVYHPRGLHGYDHEHPLMRAIFVARGPAFPHAPNSRIPEFQNIEVYNMLCDSLGIEPYPNNGTLRLPLTPIGLHDAGDSIEEPADPVAAYTQTSTSKIAAATLATPASIGVDPVHATPATATPATIATTAAGVPTSSTVDPAGQSLPTAPANSSDDKSALDDAVTTAQDFWDWLSSEFEKAWHKVAGGNKAGKGSQE